MKKNSLLSLDLVTETLTPQERIKLPFFILMSLIMTVIFVFIAVALFFVGNPIGAALMGSGFIFFIITFRKFKIGKIKLATSLSTIALLIAESIVVYFLLFGPNPYGLYRILAFTLFLFVSKFLLTSSLKELLAFAVWSVAMFVTKAMLSYEEMPVDQLEVFIACVAISLVCIVGTMLVLASLFMMMNSLTAYADGEKQKVESAFSKVTNVLTESKQGLEVGTILSEEAVKASLDLQKMASAFSSLKAASNELSNNISVVLELFSSIEANSSIMQDGTQAQNSSIAESSVALTEISTNLSSVNNIASQRSENMKSLLDSLKSQKMLVQEALLQVQKVKESSSSIGGFIHTVEDIANQTGLLAMNASIEAAHAGTAGKGFAVIAQEIRKLSEETAKNASYIGEVLQGNEQTVEAAANAVISFASQSEQSSEELQSTIEALDGILMGIAEMDIGTRGVMNSMQEIVESSRQNGSLVDDVSGKIVQQREIMDNISIFAKTLQNEVSTANVQITNVQGSLETIKTSSEENVKVSGSVNEALNNIDI